MLDFMPCSDSCYSVLSVHKDAFGQSSLLSFGDVLWSVPFRSGLSRMSVWFCWQFFYAENNKSPFVPPDDDFVVCCSGFVLAFITACFLHLGVTRGRVLHTLEVLDRHCFDRADSAIQWRRFIIRFSGQAKETKTTRGVINIFSSFSPLIFLLYFFFFFIQLILAINWITLFLWECNIL